MSVPVSCESTKHDFHAYLNGALPEAGRAAIEAHIHSCATCNEVCRSIIDTENSIRNTLREEPIPPSLWPRVLADLRADRRESGRRPFLPRGGARRVWIGAAATTIVAVVALILTPGHEPAAPPQIEQALADVPVMELRAFLDSRRPVDVESTDPAFLREWFVERVDFAPPAVTPRVDDAALIGGRLCLFLARRVASYMYRAGDHLISLYVMEESGLTAPTEPAVHLAGRQATAHRIEGFTHVVWREDGLLYSLVSDLPKGRLLDFAGGLSI